MEKSDGHERDLSAEEESNDNNEHQGGALGISLVEDGVDTEKLYNIYYYISVKSISLINPFSPASSPSDLQVGDCSPQDNHLRGAGKAGAPCP